MARNVWKLTLPLIAVALVLTASSRAEAYHPFSPRPVVTHYQPVVHAPVVAYRPAVAHYYTPVVTHHYTPVVTHHYTPAVSFYPAPAVAVPGAASTTTRYGLFGRPKSTTTHYYQPAVVFP